MAGDTWRQGEDAMVNWNNSHWTVLQPDPSGHGWMHTNSITGPGLAHVRRRRIAEGGVDALLEAIRAQSGAVELHALTLESSARCTRKHLRSMRKWRTARQGKTARRGTQATGTPRS